MNRIITLAAAAALALAACGGDDPDADVEPEATVDDDGSADDDTSGDDTSGGDTSGGDTSGDDADDATDPDDAPDATTPADEANGKPSVAIVGGDVRELTVTDIREGTGEPAELGDTVELSYVGVLADDGTEFDNSYDRETTIPVTVGAGQVIPGLEDGLLGIKEGGRRQIDIPAAAAYGSAGFPDIIPPDSSLSFVVDAVSITRPVPATIPEQADPSECPATDGSEEQQREFDEYPPFCIDVDAEYQAELATNFGTITIDLDPTQAPLTVNNFVVLARYGYFDGTECHRAIPDFVIQCGDPTATGTGGPGYQFPDELPLGVEYQIGSIAMANSGPDTNGSQFFIISGPSGAALPPQYSLFGQVGDGLNVVAEMDAVGNPENNGVPPLDTIIIESVTITGP